MFSYTEKVLFSSQVVLSEESIKLVLVQNSNKEVSVFLFKTELFKIISKAEVVKISQIAQNSFSWELQGLLFSSDLKTLETLLKSDLLFEAQDLFSNPFDWTNKYSLSKSAHSIISNTQLSEIDHVKYTIQKIQNDNKICTFESVKVWVGSWNVNSQTDFPKSLESWVLNDDYDICVFGFQELDTSTEAYLVQDNRREQEWSILVEKHLKMFTKIASKQLVGMLILVYVKSRHEKVVSQVYTDSVGTGLLGVMGNKGAVAVRFMFKDSHFCFINSHLAADVTTSEKRNQDFREICSRLAFSMDTCKDFEEYCLRFPWIPVDWNKVSFDTLSKSELSIFDVDHLVWLGDLNYRVLASEEHAKELIRANELETLLARDQLIKEMQAQRVFQTFKEGNITFPPTYKFHPGTDNYYDGEKQRTPSWCDRILWHKNPRNIHDETWINLNWYRAAMNFNMSDHKPIMASFDMKTRTVDYNIFQKTVDSISRELDRLENASLPTVKIYPHHLKFGDVGYRTPKTCSFMIDNVPAEFMLAPRPGTTTAMQPWCHLSQSSGTVLPGHKLEIFVTLYIEHAEQARNLTYGKSKLNEILVVRILNSSDFFVSIEAGWLPTIFGLDITFLCLLKKSLRSYSISECSEIKTQIQVSGGKFSRMFIPEVSNLNGISDFDNALDPSIRYSIPKQIWSLIDFLYNMGDPVVEFNIHSGVYQYICECLCHGVKISTEIFESDQKIERADSFNFPATPLNPKDEEILLFESRVKSWNVKSSTALTCGLKVLFDFLAEIPEPIIPYSLYNRVITDSFQTISSAKTLLYQIPTLNYNLFIYLCSFFKYWLKKDKKGTLKSNLSKMNILKL